MSGGRSPAPIEAEDLRGRFENAAPVIDVDPDPVVRRGRRRRAAIRTASGLGVAAAALAAVLVVQPWGGGVQPWGGGTTSSTPPPPEPTRPVAIQIVPDVVGPGDPVTAVLLANEQNQLTFGVAAEVDRWDGREWRRAGVTGLCLDEWGCAGTISDRLDAVEDIGLSATPGANGPSTVLSTEGLTDGWYRLVQRAVRDEGLATGLFQVRTGTDSAPLPPQDGVRLTIEPVLVPPEGGVARVTTHVPPDSTGTLSAEDIEAVDDALDPSALVQRWDGRRWVDVDDVAVQPREGGLGVEWGSPIALPALEEGAYRLVRTGPGITPSPWGVFTVSAKAPPLLQPESESDLDPSAAEDVYAPDHLRCQGDPGRCLLEAWWRDVIAAAGVQRGGGDHDIGLRLTDSIRVSDQRYLWLVLVPTEAAPPVDSELVVSSTAQIGETTVDAGWWDGDESRDGRRLTCGGFVVQTSSTDLEPGEVDDVVERLAQGLTDCPADVAALAARYPDHPAIR